MTHVNIQEDRVALLKYADDQSYTFHVSLLKTVRDKSSIYMHGSV